MDNPIQALVLNRLRYGETSLILRLFTERYGLISGILKGAINSKKW
ncbi:MAG: DNA repair protein RecO, partial [Proteobacteria bacterium]|nr:DNA repair protein RecO [Pseudomonadota bacterium]